ncbi:helix-turn-helix domain-containing protein [Streptomyces sp. NPDC021012]|uniref:helix-turn-helix domain-containing protein n=1 Tax=Streptomyces sp. NPDC021012 TaxID=3365107 RepID=UPI0037A2D3C4
MNKQTQQDGPPGGWLRAAVAAAGYDLSERGSATRLAADAGIPMSVASRLLNGQGEPSPDTLRKLAPVLRMSEVALFTVAYALDNTPAPASPPRPVVTTGQALTAWGITASEDRELVEKLVERLRPR